MIEEPPAQPSAAVAQPQRRPIHRFTRENAREFAAMGNKVRWSQPAKVPTPEPLPATPNPVAETDAYLAKRLLRVRKQIDRIDDLLDNEEDPAKIDRLASARSRLSEDERILDGRPLPGSRKPASKPDRVRPGAMMAEPVPELVMDTPSGSVPQSSPPTTSDDPSI